MLEDPSARPANAKRRRRQIQLGIVAGVVWILLMVLLAFGLGFIGGEEDEYVAGNDAPQTPLAASQVVDRIRPVGLIAEVRSSADIEADVRQFDYVYKGQIIPLDATQGLTIVFFESCREEDLSGGEIVVGALSSAIDPQGRKSGRALSCRPSEMMLPPEISVPSRQGYQGPFDEQVWRENTVVSFNPVFLLPAAPDGQEITISFKDAEKPGAEANWSGPSMDHYIAYPQDAPRLAMGRPYAVEATLPDGRSTVSYFSVEPDSGVTLNVVNDFVVLGSFPEDISSTAESSGIASEQ